MTVNTKDKIAKLEEISDTIHEMERHLMMDMDSICVFMDSLPLGIVIFDSDFNVTFANRNALKSLNYTSLEDIEGKTLKDITPNIETTERYRQYLRVLETGDSENIDDLQYRLSIGNRKLAMKAFKMGDGLGIIGVDITDVKDK